MKREKAGKRLRTKPEEGGFGGARPQEEEGAAFVGCGDCV